MTAIVCAILKPASSSQMEEVQIPYIVKVLLFLFQLLHLIPIDHLSSLGQILVLFRYLFHSITRHGRVHQFTIPTKETVELTHRFLHTAIETVVDMHTGTNGRNHFLLLLHPLLFLLLLCLKRLNAFRTDFIKWVDSTKTFYPTDPMNIWETCVLFSHFYQVLGGGLQESMTVGAIGDWFIGHSPVEDLGEFDKELHHVTVTGHTEGNVG
mmetsp:Transcript_8033/g.13765  ORF Transcript_8033/g.13765 Transcript_8033/m.13765 type:complete len:210 (+) Transcript_8033:329-958(+)